MTKKEIVKQISERIGLTQLKTKDIVQQTFDAIVDTLIEVGRIELRNFGVFEKQGLKHVPVSDTFRAEYFAAARAARERLGDKLVPRALMEHVLALLADYRAEHGRGK